MRKILIFILLLINVAVAKAQFTFNTPGNSTYEPKIGQESFYFYRAWGGGGAGDSLSGGGGSPCISSKLFYLDSSSTPIKIYIGRGGRNAGNPSKNGENSWIIAPNGDTVFTGFGKSNGTSFTYPIDANRQFSSKGGQGALNCSNQRAGGGGGGAATYRFNGGDGNAPGCFIIRGGIGGYGINGLNGINGQQIEVGKGGKGSVNPNFLENNNNVDGFNPGGGGGGLSYIQSTPVILTKGGNGSVEIEGYAFNGTPGSIAQPYTVPFPREWEFDSIRSISQASGYNPGGNSIIYRWVYSTDGINNWLTVPGNNFGRSCKIPSSDATGFYYRRIATNVPYPDTISNVVRLKVFSNINGKNGQINGRVTFKNPTIGPEGVKIYAQKQTDLKSSPKSHIDSTVTISGGYFTLSNLYYGDANNDPPTVKFNVWPVQPLHQFSPDTIKGIQLSALNPAFANAISFQDTTALSITGKIFQQCKGCLNEINNAVDTFKVGVDSAIINEGLSSVANSDGNGMYATSVPNPGSITLTPKYKNHLFSPGLRSIVVNGPVSGQDFEDITKRTISGRLTDGGGDPIGLAILEFTDTVAGRSGFTFRKRDTTTTSGDYSINLPARAYRVKVINFTSNISDTTIPQNPRNPRYISPSDVNSFFNQLLPKDSLYRNIDSSNQTLNLVYRRRPVIAVTNLVDTACNPAAGVIFFQNKRKPFTIQIFEGAPVIGHPVFTLDKVLFKDSLSAGDSVVMITDLLKQSGNEPNRTFKMRLTAGKVDTAISAGVPNITSPYNRLLNFTYKDRYGRTATLLERKATTVGILSQPGTFNTVAPEVPQIILHRPPGDESYSFWEKTETVENIQRLSVSKKDAQDAFLEVKVGADFALGIGVQVQTKIEASLNTSISRSFTNINENELLFSNSTTTRYSTKAGGILGSGGDVYIGGAINYKYAVASVLALQNVSGICQLDLSDKMIVAPVGFATTFTYSEDHIKNTIMPTLNFMAAYSTGALQADYQNQLNVWQQILDNNAYQKENAEFKVNRSFDGSAGYIEESQKFTKSSVNTVSFNLEIDKTIAGRIGAEINGTGISGGATVNFKSETGESSQNTLTTETITGYYLKDKDGGDYYSVDIKRDKVYGTPVFDLVAGTSSCPPEPLTQSRDFPRIIIDTPVYNNVPNTAERFIKIKVVNISQSREPRNYLLNVNNSTSDGLVININGNILGVTDFPINNLAYNIPREITMSVKKFNPNSTDFSWSDIELNLQDNCNGGVEATNTFSVNFVTQCSGIVMDEPADNWKSSAANQSIIPIEFSGYNGAAIDSVVVQYAKTGTNAWQRGMMIPGFQIINNSANTKVPWNVSNLPDSTYKIRLQMFCSGNIKFTTPSVLGVLDRRPPILTGKPQPVDDIFNNGDEISFTYNKPLNTDNTAGINVNLVRLIPIGGKGFSETPIPSAFSIFNKKLTIVPLSSITNVAGEQYRVVVDGVSDLLDNSSLRSDTNYFRAGAGNAPDTFPAVKLYATDIAKYEDSLATMLIHFKLPAVAKRITKVFYSISGTASFENDYSVSTDTVLRKIKIGSTTTSVPLYSYLNGSNGFIFIDSLKQEAILRIKPIANKLHEGDKPIVVTLLSGGDYSLSDSLSAIVTIFNDDPLNSVIDSSGPLLLCGGSVLLTVKPLNAVQFASGIRGYSSQLGNTVKRILGAPNVYPAYGGNTNAWSPATPDNNREFVELGYSSPTAINFIDIYETYKPGAIDTVYVKNPNTGLYQIIYTKTAAPQAEVARKLRIRFKTTSFAVSEIRLAMASGAVPGKNEIDAVAIGDSTPYTTYLWTPGGATTASITANAVGNYSVQVTDANGWKGFSDTVQVKSSGLSGTLIVGPQMPAICPGSGSIALGGSFTGTLQSAIWSDGGAGGSFTNNTGSTPATTGYTAAANANDTIRLTLSTQGCATKVSKIVLVNGETTWLGSTNNWNVDANWSLGKVPFACTVVNILAGTTNPPVISGIENTCKMLYVQPGTILTVEAGAILNITGNQ